MRTLLLLVATLVGCAAHAQPVYRCGASYSQTPCEQGRAVDVSDARSARQQQEAADVAERDRALGDSLHQDRLERESRPRAGAGLIDGRTGHAQVAHVESRQKPGKSKKKRSAKGSQQAERYRTISAPRS